MERLAAITGRVLTQMAADGGFSSFDNVDCAKSVGVRDVPFSKYPGMGVVDMCKPIGVFRPLRNIRAGIEGDISNLKRGFNLFLMNASLIGEASKIGYSWTDPRLEHLLT
jgi:IS5 family transposase